MEIAVPAYLKKFIQCECVMRRGKVLISDASSIGKIATLSSLDKRLWKQKPVKSYTSKITIEFEEKIEINSSGLVTGISRLFKERLFLWIRAQEDIGQSALKACRSFLDHYKITEDEYSTSTAYKAWQRYLTGRQNNT